MKASKTHDLTTDHKDPPDERAQVRIDQVIERLVGDADRAPGAMAIDEIDQHTFPAQQASQRDDEGRAT